MTSVWMSIFTALLVGKSPEPPHAPYLKIKGADHCLRFMTFIGEFDEYPKKYELDFHLGKKHLMEILSEMEGKFQEAQTYFEKDRKKVLDVFVKYSEEVDRALDVRFNLLNASLTYQKSILIITDDVYGEARAERGVSVARQSLLLWLNKEIEFLDSVENRVLHLISLKDPNVPKAELEEVLKLKERLKKRKIF